MGYGKRIPPSRMSEVAMEGRAVREHADGSTIEIRVRPASSRHGVEGLRDGRVVICVHSLPEKGKANREALKLLAQALGIPSSRIELLRGHTARNKTVLARGITPSETRARLQIT
jgi:uncharacterized protein (TIGR00251 family)